MNFSATLRAHRLRATPGRVALLHVLETTRTPLRSHEILERLPKNTDRVTTYRALEQFVDAGIVRAVYFGGATRYELRDEHDHHHVVCTLCHKTQDIDICAMNELTPAIQRAATEFDSITDHSFEVFGVCKICAQSKQKLSKR